MDLLTNERFTLKPDWTIGKMYVNGAFECYTKKLQ